MQVSCRPLNLEAQDKCLQPIQAPDEPHQHQHQRQTRSVSCSVGSTIMHDTQCCCWVLLWCRMMLIDECDAERRRSFRFRTCSTSTSRWYPTASSIAANHVSMQAGGMLLVLSHSHRVQSLMHSEVLSHRHQSQMLAGQALILLTLAKLVRHIPRGA